MTRKTRQRKPQDLVTQAEAARLIGVRRQSIPGFIARGELASVTVAGMLFVSKRDAMRIGKERAERGEVKESDDAAPLESAA